MPGHARQHEHCNSMVLASTREGYWAPLRPVATFVGRGATTSGQWNRGGDPNSTALGQSGTDLVW
jgi:hypothetical protein